MVLNTEILLQDTVYYFYSAAALLAMQSAVLATTIPSVRLSHAGIVPKRIKIGSCDLYCEIVKTLEFSDTKTGREQCPLPPKIFAQSDPPPLKSDDFEQYLLITSHA